MRRTIIICALLWGAVANYSLFTIHFSHLNAQGVHVKDDIAPYRDYNGILRMGLFDFLLNPRSMEEW